MSAFAGNNAVTGSIVASAQCEVPWVRPPLHASTGGLPHTVACVADTKKAGFEPAFSNLIEAW